MSQVNLTILCHLQFCDHGREMVEAMAAQGDPDAIQVQDFEQHLADMYLNFTMH